MLNRILSLISCLLVLGCAASVLAQEKSFILTADQVNPKYVATYLGNGNIGVSSSQLGTLPTRSYMAWIYEHHPGDAGQQAVDLAQPVDEAGDRDDLAAVPVEELLGAVQPLRGQEDVAAEPLGIVTQLDILSRASGDPECSLVRKVQDGGQLNTLLLIHHPQQRGMGDPGVENGDERLGRGAGIVA